jgi:hypothetical protein
VTLVRRCLLALAVATAMHGGVVPGSAASVHAQGWTADMYAGGTRYGALVDRVSATNLIGNIRYQSLHGALGWLSVAAPLDGNAALWTAAGAQHRLRTSRLRRTGLGIDLGASAYGFRGARDAGTGGGASLFALPVATLAAGTAVFELRAGRQQHVHQYPDTNGARGLWEAGARLGIVDGAHGASLDARWLRAPEAAYPHVGVQLASAAGPARVWASAGKWLADGLDDATWSVGASVAIGGTADVWLSVRRDATDPLYLTAARHSWNLGISRRIGSPASPLPAPALAPVIETGHVRFRLPVSAARGGAPSIAGEFSEWKPVAMRREGGHWVLDLPLRSGVYRFSFVSEAGDWFVPEQYPGRFDDGMGGHMAVLVVP